MEGIHFEKELLLLRSDISRLLSLVLESFEMSVRSCEDANEKLAKSVISMDDQIDDINRKVEDSVYQIVARYHPMGKELRYVITMIKFSNNLERIGDLSVNIAEKELLLQKKHISYKPPKELKQMIGLSIQMIKDAFTAFIEKDEKKALSVWQKDDVVDQLERDIDHFVMEMMKKKDFDRHLVPIYLLLARDIERIADHATNLCEELLYIETGRSMNQIVPKE
ncbi:MAG: phosphate signaling complex protein PhoU [Thermotogaceae bacterium]|nr:phosphate signaling complex protein PhoU [Thermotogaceae bacterium]